MVEFIQSIFGINLRVMQILGHYPTQNHQKLYKIYAYTIYGLFTVPVPILAALYLLLQDHDMVSISQNAFAICELGSFVFKLLQFIKNADQIKTSLDMIGQQIFMMYTQRQEPIMRNCIEECKRNSNLFLVLCVFTTVSWACVPFFQDGHKLPLDVWLPFDITKGGKSYIFSFMFVVAGVSCVTIANGAIDPLIGGLAYYLTTQTRILKDNLTNLAKYAEEEASYRCDVDTTLQKSIYDKIKLCVDHHNAILRCVVIYKDTYSPMVFVQFSASILVICISCLRLSMVEPFTVDFFSMIIFILAILTQILFYCYYGTTLFEETNSLNTAIYMSNWYEYDIKSRKALIILMERSQKPMVVTAGKLLDLSLDTFATILRRSYSLLAVLNNYN